MSQKSSVKQAEEKSCTSSSPDGRRSTVPDIIKPQKSFEKRYSHIINQQILETSINKEALQRQINSFFQFGNSQPGSVDEDCQQQQDFRVGEELEEVAEKIQETCKDQLAESEKSQPEREVEVPQKLLEKLETLNVTEPRQPDVK